MCATTRTSFHILRHQKNSSTSTARISLNSHLTLQHVITSLVSFTLAETMYYIDSKYPGQRPICNCNVTNAYVASNLENFANLTRAVEVAHINAKTLKQENTKYTNRNDSTSALLFEV